MSDIKIPPNDELIEMEEENEENITLIPSPDDPLADPSEEPYKEEVYEVTSPKNNGDETKSNDDDYDYNVDEFETYEISKNEEFENQFSSDIQSLISFKYKIEKLCRKFFETSDDDIDIYDIFMKSIGDLNAPYFHNQVPKLLITTYLSINNNSFYKTCCVLLDNLCAKDVVKKEQLESAFRSLFHRINELNQINQSSFQIIIEFADYCVDKGHLKYEFVSQIKKQLEFSKDPKRVLRLKKHFKNIILEYFEACDMSECSRCIYESNTPFYNHEIIKQMVSLALDRDNRCRELTSKFLSENVGDNKCISYSQNALAFNILLHRVEDLYKDVPDILHLLSCFIGRCIADEVLTFKFLENIDLLETDLGYKVIENVKPIINGSFGYAKFHHCWGINQNEKISKLKNEISKIIKEFLWEEDIDDAIQSIKELNIPEFHHEIIRQIVPAVADYVPPDSNSPVSDSLRSKKGQLVSKLLIVCIKNNIISELQINRGFKRIRAQIDNIKLDSPKIERFYNEIALNFRDVPLCGASGH